MDIVNSFKLRSLDRMLALGTPKVMLLNGSHSTNVDTQDTIDDVDGNEISSANYTAGGDILANVTTTQNNAANRAELDADNLAWTDLTATVGAAVVYVDTGSAATSPIIGITEFASDQVLSTQDFNLAVSASGLVRIS